MSNSELLGIAAAIFTYPMMILAIVAFLALTGDPDL